MNLDTTLSQVASEKSDDAQVLTQIELADGEALRLSSKVAQARFRPCGFSTRWIQGVCRSSFGAGVPPNEH